MYDYRENRVRPSDLKVGAKLYYSAGHSYSKLMLSTVTKITKTTVTIEVKTPSGVVWTRVFGIDTAFDFIRNERKTKDNEFPSLYASLTTIQAGAAEIARNEARKVIQSAQTDVKNAMKVAEYNHFSSETLAEVKRLIEVLEDYRAEAKD